MILRNNDPVVDKAWELAYKNGYESLVDFAAVATQWWHDDTHYTACNYQNELGRFLLKALEIQGELTMKHAFRDTQYIAGPKLQASIERAEEKKREWEKQEYIREAYEMTDRLHYASPLAMAAVEAKWRNEGTAEQPAWVAVYEDQKAATRVLLEALGYEGMLSKGTERLAGEYHPGPELQETITQMNGLANQAKTHLDRLSDGHSDGQGNAR